MVGSSSRNDKDAAGGWGDPRSGHPLDAATAPAAERAPEAQLAACDLCRRAKKACTQIRPCFRCTSRGVPCVMPAMTPGERHKGPAVGQERRDTRRNAPAAGVASQTPGETHDSTVTGRARRTLRQNAPAASRTPEETTDSSWPPSRASRLSTRSPSFGSVRLLPDLPPGPDTPAASDAEVFWLLKGYQGRVHPSYLRQDMRFLGARLVGQWHAERWRREFLRDCLLSTGVFNAHGVTALRGHREAAVNAAAMTNRSARLALATRESKPDYGLMLGLGTLSVGSCLNLLVPASTTLGLLRLQCQAATNLGFTIDPDDDPELAALTPVEKGFRRSWYWAFYEWNAVLACSRYDWPFNTVPLDMSRGTDVIHNLASLPKILHTNVPAEGQQLFSADVILHVLPRSVATTFAAVGAFGNAHTIWNGYMMCVVSDFRFSMSHVRGRPFEENGNGQAKLGMLRDSCEEYFKSFPAGMQDIALSGRVPLVFPNGGPGPPSSQLLETLAICHSLVDHFTVRLRLHSPLDGSAVLLSDPDAGLRVDWLRHPLGFASCLAAAGGMLNVLSVARVLIPAATQGLASWHDVIGFRCLFGVYLGALTSVICYRNLLHQAAQLPSPGSPQVDPAQISHQEAAVQLYFEVLKVTGGHTTLGAQLLEAISMLFDGRAQLGPESYTYEGVRRVVSRAYHPTHAS